MSEQHEKLIMKSLGKQSFFYFVLNNEIDAGER